MTNKQKELVLKIARECLEKYLADELTEDILADISQGITNHMGDLYYFAVEEEYK